MFRVVGSHPPSSQMLSNEKVEEKVIARLINTMTQGRLRVWTLPSSRPVPSHVPCAILKSTLGSWHWSWIARTLSRFHIPQECHSQTPDFPCNWDRHRDRLGGGLTLSGSTIRAFSRADVLTVERPKRKNSGSWFENMKTYTF